MFVWYAQPLGVFQNALFVVDIVVVNFNNLKADDIGLWKGTGTKENAFQSSIIRRYQVFREKTITSLSPNYTRLAHCYFVNKGYAEYHRMIADIQSKWCSKLLISYFYLLWLYSRSQWTAK